VQILEHLLSTNEQRLARIIYDINSGLISIKRVEEVIYAGTGLHANKEGLVFAFEKEGSVVGNVWFRTLKLDFGAPSKKSLKQITLYSVGKVKLKITGEFGSTEFKLNEGFNTLNMNYRSDEFVFEFSSQNTLFTVDKLCVKYAI
jgi:hypothetical protein